MKGVAAGSHEDLRVKGLKAANRSPHTPVPQQGCICKHFESDTASSEVSRLSFDYGWL